MVGKGVDDSIYDLPKTLGRELLIGVFDTVVERGGRYSDGVHLSVFFVHFLWRIFVYI